MVKLAPSIMCSNFLELKTELDVYSEEHIDFLHIDIMDGHYVPNFTLGPGFCKTLCDYSPIPLDIHLMIENVDTYIPVFAGLGKPTICIHPEAGYHPLRSIGYLKDHGAIPGIAIDPATSLESIKYILPDVTQVCVMTVNPGYSGQSLIPQTLDKIRELKQYAVDHELDIDIEVDGNVSWRHIPAMVEAGASVLVLGTSSLFDGERPLRENIQKLRAILNDYR